MPSSPLRPCGQHGCKALVSSGRCPEHARDSHVQTSHQRGYTRKWRAAVLVWLTEDPLRHFCADPYGVHGASQVLGNQTDHIIPHRGDQQLFWDRANWQRLCLQCHGRKSREEEGSRLTQ